MLREDHLIPSSLAKNIKTEKTCFQIIAFDNENIQIVKTLK